MEKNEKMKKMFSFLIGVTFIFGLFFSSAPETAQAGGIASCFSSGVVMTAAIALALPIAAPLSSLFTDDQNQIVCIATIVFHMMGWFTGLAGGFLSTALDFHIYTLPTILKNPEVQNIWFLVRNAILSLFAPMIVYISLGIAGSFATKEALLGLIGGGIFVFFSFFAGGGIVTITAIIKARMYEQLTLDIRNVNDKYSREQGGLGFAYLDMIGITALYDDNIDGQPLTDVVKDEDALLILFVFGTIIQFVVGMSLIVNALGLLFASFRIIMNVLVFSAPAMASLALSSVSSKIKTASAWAKEMIADTCFGIIYLVITKLIFMMLYKTDISRLISGSDFAGDSTGLALVKSLLGENPNGLVYVMLVIMAIGSTITLSKKIGSGGADMAVNAGGALSGAALGASAFAARQTVGRAGNFVAKNETLKNLVANNKYGSLVSGAIAGMQTNAGKISASSFDVRALTGSAFGANLGKMGLRSGGYSKWLEEKQKEEMEKAKYYMTDSEKEKRLKDAESESKEASIDERLERERAEQDPATKMRLKTERENLERKMRQIEARTQNSMNLVGFDRLNKKEQEFVKNLMDKEKHLFSLNEKIAIATAQGDSKAKAALEKERAGMEAALEKERKTKLDNGRLKADTFSTFARTNAQNTHNALENSINNAGPGTKAYFSSMRNRILAEDMQVGRAISLLEQKQRYADGKVSWAGAIADKANEVNNPNALSRAFYNVASAGANLVTSIPGVSVLGTSSQINDVVVKQLRGNQKATQGAIQAARNKRRETNRSRQKNNNQNNNQGDGGTQNNNP